MNGIAPSPETEELRALALRITKHLQKNPGDTQARADLKYVTSQIPVESQPSPEAHPAMKIASGLMEAGLDIPKGIISSLLHPIRAAGQITGIGNAREADRVLKDPDASIAEKLDAVLRATPFNIGYAAERGLLNATGANVYHPSQSGDAAPLQEQAHAAGNVASLALLGVNRNTPGVQAAGRLVSRIPVVGPLLRAGRETIQRYTPAESSQATIQREMLAAKPSETPVPLDALRAIRDFEAGKISGADLRTAMDVAAGHTLAPMSPPPLTPMPGAPRGLMGPEGISPAPKASYPPSLAEMQGLDTNPLRQTTAEAAATAAAKALQAAKRGAARTAYNLAIAAGQTIEQAKAAAQRAAGFVQ